jgi:hypothetical protein
MSGTTTERAEGGAQPPDASTQPNTAADDATRQDAPGGQQTANDNQVEANDNDQDEWRRREDRRVAQLSARLAAEQRERERLQALFQQQTGGEETDEQKAQREKQQMRAEVEADLRRERFHAEGTAQFGNAWNQKCQDLIGLGADPMFAALVVEMPDGVKIAAALADDPEAVQRIADIRSERGRAIALGRYAAGLDRQAANSNDQDDTRSTPTTPVAATRVTSAPPPVRPVTGRTTPAFDPYNPRHSPEQLAEFWEKQERDRRSALRR